MPPELRREQVLRAQQVAEPQHLAFLQQRRRVLGVLAGRRVRRASVRAGAGRRRRRAPAPARAAPRRARAPARACATSSCCERIAGEPLGQDAPCAVESKAPLSYPRRRFAGRSIPAPLDRLAAHDRNRARAARARAGRRLERARGARRRRRPQVAERLSARTGCCSSLGTLFFALLIAGLVAALRVARARDAPQPAPAGLPRRRDPRDEDAARVAAALPRHARPPRSRPGAAARVPRPHAPGRASASSAPSTRCSPPRAPRARRARRARAVDAARAARTRASTRCASSTSLADRGAAPRDRRRSPSRSASARELGWCSATCSTTRSSTRGGPVDVRVARAAPGDGRVRVEIEDRGIGIPRHELRRIFQPLLPRGPRRAAPGEGPRPRPLHRALPRAAAGRHASRRAARGPGRGSRFVVTLRAPPRAAASRRREPTRARSAAGPPAAMSRILVVEDEAHIAEGLRFNLEAEGHAVESLARRPRGRGAARRGERALRPRDPRPDAARDERLRGRAPRARRGQLRADPDPHREGRRARRRARASRRARTTT